MSCEHEEIINEISYFHWELFMTLERILHTPTGTFQEIDEIQQKCKILVKFGK